MLQQPQPDDFVIASGVQHSVREFVELAGARLGMQIAWQGAGIDEVGVDQRSQQVMVRVDPRYFRPTEVDTLLGDSSKARALLGWQAEVTFEQLVTEMVAADLEHARRDALIRQHGYRVPQRHE
jgi:GDPmannose 4,6-dehydratase